MSREALQQYWREVRAIADEESVSVSRARTLWRQRKESEKNTASRVQIDIAVNEILERAEALEDDEAVFCPYCRVGFFEDDAVVTCKGCKTKVHDDCADEFRRCPIIGCRKPFTASRSRSVAGESQEERRLVRVTVPQRAARTVAAAIDPDPHVRDLLLGSLRIMAVLLSAAFVGFYLAYALIYFI